MDLIDRERSLRQLVVDLELDRSKLVDEIRSIEEQLTGRKRAERQGNKTLYGHNWLDAAKAEKDNKTMQLQTVNSLLGKARGELGQIQARRPSRTEAKLDLLLKHLEIDVPMNLRTDLPYRSEETLTDQHGTPWEDALRHRVPGSFESRQR